MARMRFLGHRDPPCAPARPQRPDRGGELARPPQARTRGIQRLAAGLITALGAACQAPAGATAERASEPESPPRVVVTSRALSQPFESSQTFSGEAWAVAEAALSVGEAGRVRRVLVAEGARVKQGQLLLELEDGLARAELGRAQATEARVSVEQRLATREASRFAELSREQVVSERENMLEQSQAKALSAEESGARAAVQVSRERVQRHRILAPFDGTISTRSVDPGDWLTPGQPALELVTEERVEVHVRVPPWVLSQSPSGSPATLQSGVHSVPARVTSRVGALDRQTRTGLIRLEPEQRPDWLRPGAAVLVRFRTRRSDGLTVPSDALVYGLTGVRVLRVTDGKADPVAVTVLQTAGDRALVTAPELRAGDELIVRGNERIAPGQAVTTEGAISGHTPEPAANRDNGGER